MTRKENVARSKKIRELSILPELFNGWTLNKIYISVKRTFKSDPTWIYDNVLHPQFRKNQLARVGYTHWSTGYCYDIVDVVAIILDAIPLSYKRLLCATKKNAIGRLQNHHVLQIDNQVFDPQKGPTEPLNNYTGSGYRTSHMMPISPSERSLALFKRILATCRKNGQFTIRQGQIIDRFEQNISNL